jgi:hypothetical protein
MCWGDDGEPRREAAKERVKGVANLQNLVQCMTNVKVAVSVGRAVVEDKLEGQGSCVVSSERKLVN